MAKLSAYLAGSLPVQTTPSINLLVRITSFGMGTPTALAACLLTCQAMAQAAPTHQPATTSDSQWAPR